MATVTFEALLAEVPDPGWETPGSRRPTLASARACVEWMSIAVYHLNCRIGVEPPAAVLVHDLVLTSASEVALFWLHGSFEQAKTSLVRYWIQSAELENPPRIDYLLKHVRDVLSGLSSKEGVVRGKNLDSDREFLLAFSTAVTESLAAQRAEAEARQTLRRLMTQLDLSKADLARMLRSRPETVEQWESGGSRIPAERRALLARASSALATLASIFRPERLPQVIRQQVELFDGQSAYDWILQGRIQEVADRYETAFAYQG